MKETVKTSRTAGYLEKIFRALNERYFDNELEEPIITIQSTPKAYAHVTIGKAWQRGDTTRRELNIGAGTLDRSIFEIVASELHECIHIYNMQHGIQDCSRSGQYHNRKFKAAAEARDLKISYDPRIGWSITEPTEALCEFVLEQGWDDIRMNRMAVLLTKHRIFNVGFDEARIILFRGQIQDIADRSNFSRCELGFTRHFV